MARFCVQIGNSLGISPHQWVQEKRQQTAKQIGVTGAALRDPRNRVSEVTQDAVDVSLNQPQFPVPTATQGKQ